MDGAFFLCRVQICEVEKSLVRMNKNAYIRVKWERTAKV